MSLKPHLSQTQLEMYAKCPAAWERRYVNGEIIPPGVAALKGSGVHGAAEQNFRQKITSHVDLPVADIADLAAAAFDARVERESVKLDPEEKSRGKRKVLGEAKDATVKMAKFHAYEQAPSYQPILVEERVRIGLPGAHDLVVILDLADELDRVVDFKNGKKRHSQADVDSSVQLSVEAVGFQAITKRPAKELVLDTIVTGSKQLERHKLTTTRDRDDRMALAHRVDAVSRAIQTGIFPPATPGAWWCLSMDTEILTQRGWMGPDTIRQTDLAMTFNRYSHLLEWQQPTAFIRKPWGKPMVTYDGRGLKFSVTPDHRMLVRTMGRGLWRETLAQDIKGKGSIAYPVAAYMARSSTPRNDDELALSGWMCAEGHFRNESAMIEIAQSRNSPFWVEIESLLRRMQLEFSTWDHPGKPNTSCFRIRSEDSRVVRTAIQSSKSIPNWLWDADGRQFRVWLTAFMKGDGSTSIRQYGDATYSVGQKDESFIDELQALCITHRMSAVKSETRRVSSSGGQISTLTVMDGITERIPEPAAAKKHFIEATSDEVWCVTVPNGFIMTRYRGRTLITGNCSPKWCGYHATCPFVNGKRGS